MKLFDVVTQTTIERSPMDAREILATGHDRYCASESDIDASAEKWLAWAKLEAKSTEASAEHRGELRKEIATFEKSRAPKVPEKE